MRFYHDFNILIERHEKAQKALDGKLPELAAQHLGNIGLAYAEEIGFFMSVSILKTSCALTKC